MEHFTNIVIGFGKGGKTLAKYLATHGQDVLVIERSAQMYGGTCINVGCLPSKSLILNGQKGVPFAQATQKRAEMTAQLRQKNYHLVADEPRAQVVNATAQFLNDHSLLLTAPDGQTEQVSGERIFINTGATPRIPAIPGLKLGERVLDSQRAMELPQQPHRLAILGGGPIGLEFAAMFASYGSQVTLFDPHEQLLHGFEPEVQTAVTADLQASGLTLQLASQVSQVTTTTDTVTLTYHQAGQTQTAQFDYLLVATGRQPNTAELGLSNTTIATTPTGAIKVDEHLRTTAPNVWALGDVNGGPQFTYISLDDFRIVKDQLFGAGTRSTADRHFIPTTTFLTPPLATIGLTQAAAQAAGHQVLVFQLKTQAIPKARVMEDQRGLYKVIVDQHSHEILGATLYAQEAHEVINLIALAMNGHLKYELLRDMLYTHPTMAEALNDLFQTPLQQ